MALLPIERRCALFGKLADAESLQDVLDLLAAEIDANAIADGYLVNLLDVSGQQLASLKIHYTPAFRYLEQTYLGYKIPLNDGNLNARLMSCRRTERINHTTPNPAEQRVLHYWKICEMVGVAIGNPADPAAAPIGVIVLLAQDQPVSEDKLAALQELLAIFYKSLANWLRFSHLESMHEAATSAVEENKRLLQFIEEMHNLTSVETIYEVFAAELFRQLPFSIAGFSLVENNRLVAQKVIAAAPQFTDIGKVWENYLFQHPYPLDPLASGAVYVLLRNTPLFFRDLHLIQHLPTTPHDEKSLALLKTARSLYVCPIRYQRQAIGVFALYNLEQPVSLSEADQQMLEHLASFLGTALTNGKLYATSQEQNHKIGELNARLQEKVRQLAEQASTDQLTGLFNFRSFEQELKKRLTEAGRTSNQNNLSLAVIDIDHFKQFNDTHGHAAGNDILVGVADEINKHIRQTDMACRYGGEEFVLILPKCDLDGAMLMAERIRSGIEAAIFKTCAGQHQITVSIGCTVHLPGDSRQSLFSRADQALYLAKHAGRNMVRSQ